MTRYVTFNHMKGKNYRGMAAVELAIILPIFLTVMLAMIGFSVYFYDRIILIHAAREAARYGIVLVDPKKTKDEIAGVATSHCENMINFSVTKTSCSADIIGAAGNSGGELIVTMNYILTVPMIFPNGKNVTAKITMRHE